MNFDLLRAIGLTMSAAVAMATGALGAGATAALASDSLWASPPGLPQ